MAFNVAERIQQVRAVEAKIKAMEEEFDGKVKPFEDFVDKARTEILQFLNDTKQKSTNTEFGTAYWKPKITYRVEDKDAFRRHVLGAEAYELITWASAPVACEAFMAEHQQPPPGLVRNSVNILYITAPAKPRKRTPKEGEPIGEQGEPAGQETAGQEPEPAK